jgi:hypothetical protein
MGLASGCTVGAVTFSNFEFMGSSGVTANQVLVSIVNSGGKVGLEFSGPFSVSAGSAIDVLLSYVMNSANLTGADLSISNFSASGNANAQVAESLCIGGIPDSSGNCTGSGGTQSMNVFVNGNTASPTDSVSFAGVTTVAVNKNIILQGGAAGSGSSATIGAVDNTTAVPEPTSLWILGSGLIAASVALRRRRV